MPADDDTPIKLAIARRTLGTALALFLEGRDPVSVQTLVCAGCEIAENEAKKANDRAWIDMAISSGIQMSAKEYRDLRNRFGNEFKHPRSRRHGASPSAIEEFSNAENVDRLFLGWFDYMIAAPSMPIEASVFMAWVMALRNPDFEGDEHQGLKDGIEAEFPGLRGLPPERQRKRLRRAIEKWRKNREVVESVKTDRRPLMLGWPPNPTATTSE